MSLNTTDLDFADNRMSNIARNTTHSGENLHDIPISLIVVGISVCTWIIITNAVVFLFFVTSEKARKSSVTVQLLSLSLTDMLVGICTTPVFLTPVLSLFSKYETCACIMFMYFVSQGATINHALLICIHRLIIIRRKSNAHHNNKEKLQSVLVQIMLIWFGCVVFYAIPFLVFARFGEEVVPCSLNNVFRDKYFTVTRLMSILFLLPYICTNILYVYLLVYLRRRLRTVDATQVTLNNQSADISQRGDKLDNIVMTPVENPTHIKSVLPGAFKNTNTLYLEPGPSTDRSKRNCRTIHVKEPDMNKTVKAQSTKDMKTDANEQIRGRAKEKTQKRRDISTHGINVMGASNSFSRLKKQRHVLNTIGIILISLNVFMAPLTFTPVFEFFQFGYLTRRVKFVFLAMAMLNSALNPIINVWRIIPFQENLRSKARKVANFICLVER